MYAAAVAGGVWKSTNGGASWTPLTDLAIPNIAVNSLAIDPKNPNVLYAGTGEGYFNGDASAAAASSRRSTAARRGRSSPAPSTTRTSTTSTKIVVSPRSSTRL